VLSGTEDPELVGKAVGEGAEEYEVKGLTARGYLGGVVRAAVVLRASRARLADPRPVELEELSELDTLSEAVAVLEADRLRLVNRTWRRLFDWSEKVPVDLPSLVRDAVTRVGRVGGRPATGPGPITAWGEGVVQRADGRKTSVRYIVETWPVPSGPRVLLRIRPRAATGTGSGSGRDPAWVAPSGGADPTPLGPLPNRGDRGAVLDSDAWVAIREIAGGNPTFVPQLLDSFRTYGAELVTALVAADDRRDLDEVQRSAHTLKSTSAQVGATRLAEISRDIENACRAGRSDRARELVAQVEPEFREVLKALRSPPGA
ncbi:MAG: Hpt domain-containing protein, partial [Thermoplasmata archaeon]|nr:Hpt domain-containing protein [Thermoplasmata archaeon]